PQVHVDVLEGPQVVEFGLDKEGNVEVVVGLTFKVSVFGETRLLVQTCRGAGDWPEDLDHDWDWVSQEEMLPSGTRSRQYGIPAGLGGGWGSCTGASCFPFSCLGGGALGPLACYRLGPPVGASIQRCPGRAGAGSPGGGRRRGGP